MNIKASKHVLSGNIRVPGSKSHTIRALLLAALSDGISHIKNPLPSADCISAGNALPLIGADIDFGEKDSCNGWTVTGAGKNAHLPDDVVNVGNSGSLLYFFSPITATFPGWSIFTGDESIRTGPVNHVVDVLKQMGAEAYISQPDKFSPPLIIHGPITAENKIVTDGRLSQYISGIMMAAVRLPGTVQIELTDPKEVPYLTMTKLWLESMGVPVSVSKDFKHITVKGPCNLHCFDTVIPSDWEAVAFPLIAALLTDSEIFIENIDDSGSQGDELIIGVLQSVGADIEYDRKNKLLHVCGGQKARPFENRTVNKFLTKETIRSCSFPGRLSAKGLKNEALVVNMADFPDAVCALAVISCFIEGRVVLKDIDVCRKKETDRIAVLSSELSKLGAKALIEGDNFIIEGQSPKTAEGFINEKYKLHGGVVESFKDHRVAMAFACMGLALDETVTVKNAECCSVSFPHFIEEMNKLGADFKADA